jgi:tetratricopeptide (TPR) repeat protein
MRARIFASVAVLAVACASRAPAPSDEHATSRPPRAPILPPERALAGGPGTERFMPSLMSVVAARPDAGTVLTDVETCGGCHADVAAMWRTSAHAFGSFNNPIYRASVDRFRQEKGETTSRWCGGCHDIALMSDTAMDHPVEAKEPRAHGGITCRTCHGITSARPDGNGSYDLDTTSMPIPKDGDAASVVIHKQKAAPAPLRTAALCTTCHRVFLDEASGNAHHLPGQDDATPWARSAYAASLSERIDEPVPERDCKSCHMAREEATLGDAAAKNGKIASHRFLGAHTWLASMRGDADQLARVKAFLAGSATIDVSAVKTERGRTFPADGATLERGDDVVLGVTLRNRTVGHRFPGGVVDAADAWVEVTVDDARGRRVAEAGTRHDVDPEDETAHVLRATLLDDTGQPVRARETDRFRAVVTNHTLAPRDAEVVEYAFTVPRALEDSAAFPAFPLRVTARLRHRTRSLAVQRLVCNEAATPRARSFRDEGRRRTGVALDPCASQPITEIATSVVFVGGALRTPVAPAADEWRRLYDYGLGLSHALQEWVGEARPPLERALAVAPGDRERAMVMSILAQIASREGRPEEAIAWADRAEPLAPGHPALARVRGEALANVWRWVDAVPHLENAARLTPRDDSSFTRLALAAGSAGLGDEAIEATRRGLALQPRDADLLRVQALAFLALPSLGATADAARSAEDAYLRHRPADEAPGIRAKCSRDVPGCALERNPVHTHEMRAAR